MVRSTIPIALGALAASTLACATSETSLPDLEEHARAPATQVAAAVTAGNDVDILFVIDDSPGMRPAQQQLVQHFPQLLRRLEDAAWAGHAASLHIGVISTDLGAGHFTLGGGQCRPGGKGGRLIARGDAGPAGCQGPAGARFIDLDLRTGMSNLPGGQDAATTFACMASLGDLGCGFEQPLEAAYRALRDVLPENAGFARAGASLVVVFVTDEDDCSAPASTDLFDPSPAATSRYGTLGSYRCSRFGVACGTPARLLPAGASGGPLAACRGATAAEGGLLFDVDRYIRFFADPARPGVILAGLAAPAAPVVTSCAGTPCRPALDASCRSPLDTRSVGAPAVRLRQVIGAMPAEQQLTGSICEPSYAATLDELGVRIAAQLAPAPPSGGEQPAAAAPTGQAGIGR